MGEAAVCVAASEALTANKRSSRKRTGCSRRSTYGTSIAGSSVRNQGGNSYPTQKRCCRRRTSIASGCADTGRSSYLPAQCRWPPSPGGAMCQATVEQRRTAIGGYDLDRQSAVEIRAWRLMASNNQTAFRSTPPGWPRPSGRITSPMTAMPFIIGATICSYERCDRCSLRNLHLDLARSKPRRLA